MADERPREKSLHDLVRFVSVSTLITPAITLGVSMVIARALGPEGRGAYGIIVTAVSILPTLLGLGFDFAVRYWSARPDNDTHAVLKTTTALGSLIGGVGGGLILLCGWLGYPEWLIPAGLSTEGIWIYASVIFVSSLTGLWGNYLMGLERYGYATYGRNLAMAVQVVALVGFWLFGTVTLEIALAALALQLAIIFGLFFALEGSSFRRSLRSRLLPRPELNDMLRYAWWQYLSSMLIQTNMRLNIFLLVALQGLYETGLYTAVLGPAGLLWVLAAPLIRVLSVRSTRRSEDPEFPQRVAGAMRVTLLITTLGGIAAATVAPLVIPLLFGEKFVDAVEPFWVLIPGTIAFSVCRVVVQYLAGVKRPKWNSVISGVGAAVTLGMSLVLIPPLGASGAAAATSIAYFASTAVSLFAFVRVSGLPIGELMAFRVSDWSPLLRVLGIGRGSASS
jgi:O-antigen/teichoic acid export membrane protein